MEQSIVHIALVVKDYDEAIDFYVNTLNFELVEDTYQPDQDKRWVVVSPPGSKGVTLLLPELQRKSRNRLLETRLVVECSYFCVPMISGATTKE